VHSRYRFLLMVSVAVLILSVVPICTDVSADEGYEGIGYESLNEGQKEIYERFASGIEERSHIIIVGDFGITTSEMQIIQYAYMTDHPENFWASYFDAYTTDKPKQPEHLISVSCKIDFDDTKLDSMSAEINSVVSSFSPSGSSMADRIKSIHDFIVGKASYSLETRDCGNIYGALVEGKCKCDGYSLAMAYLCQKNGIKDVVVEIGKVKGETSGHAWNIIKMDNGKWYYLDLTWDDGSDYLYRYDYFLIGSDTDTQKGSFADTRTVYYDYGITVSKDKYDYNPYGWEKYILYIVVGLLILFIVLLLLFRYFRKCRLKQKRQKLADSQPVPGLICEQCGNVVPAGDLFCRQCGKEIAKPETGTVPEESGKKE